MDNESKRPRISPPPIKREKPESLPPTLHSIPPLPSFPSFSSLPPPPMSTSSARSYPSTQNQPYSNTFSDINHRLTPDDNSLDTFSRNLPKVSQAQKFPCVFLFYLDSS